MPENFFKKIIKNFNSQDFIPVEADYNVTAKEALDRMTDSMDAAEKQKAVDTLMDIKRELNDVLGQSLNPHDQLNKIITMEKELAALRQKLVPASAPALAGDDLPEEPWMDEFSKKYEVPKIIAALAAKKKEIQTLISQN